MHSEITNTPYPGSALNPCCICTLSAPSLAAKHRKDFMYKFLHLDRHGNVTRNRPRVWLETIKQTHKLFKVATEDTIVAFDTLSKEYGVKDRINEKFIEQQGIAKVKAKINDLKANKFLRLFNPFLRLIGFDGCLDTPVEILHVFLLGVVKYLVHDFVGKLSEKQKDELEGRIESFNTSSLNMPKLQPKYLVSHVKSLIGKEFKIFLQAAPFILFPFMDEDQREIWISLCTLSSYAFQTHINNMEDFQLNLRKHTANFFYRIIRVTAQWVNKPKFHILLHLADSIRRFGPATLFSTEKFESYNGVLRTASTHSNRICPGRDIAIKFANFHAL
ncbi:hypothetical protein PGTUg99_005723 [Puccinia graminis f. sp. tritici]|uniref:Uncharacterized protein n=1 Tax=Puccinia graminis f. sp. tritici TaxID=56615 RepID=A0A5B0MPW3_PUCGR|nr:hypothetical protein PGTUg99_005723 [Puccinia graminis f. sp. tritici]